MKMASMTSTGGSQGGRPNNNSKNKLMTVGNINTFRIML